MTVLSFLTGTFCRLCQQHKRAPKQGVSKRPFIEAGCQLYRVDYLDKHMAMEHHKQCVESPALLVQGNQNHFSHFNQ